MVFAHSRNAAGQRHDLDDHLRTVADLAAGFAMPFGGQDVARLAGRLHDIGKASDRFQDYLAACEREPERSHRSVDHKAAGVLAALDVFPDLAFLIQGHHGGLSDQSLLRTTVRERQKDAFTNETWQRAAALGLLPRDGMIQREPSLPPFVTDERRFEFFLRLCFSALVDADHLDTERHFSPAAAAERGGLPSLATLSQRLTDAQEALTNQDNHPVNQVRDEVYRACLAAAEQKPGFFRLTVPTGGGKTRSSLSFALRHALVHDLRRVVVAVPFLTITDQTAEVYRTVLGDDRAVLEHYSGANASDDNAGEPTPRATWQRLAAQDWDAPVIVTTTVQLFESLFGRTPAACRKLHRLARSVIILDEAQTLPPSLLTPILDALSELVANYGTSVVLCTATQPALAHAPGFERLRAMREIAPDPPRLFRTLKRVTYEWPTLGKEPWEWARVAATMRAEPQALAIVNTKADALALLAALDDADAFHLSTLLCGAHRRDVLARVRHRLDQGQPCRVVSTQVVEAGVDLDFPLVLRAMGPLDRIVQAADRCNREGRLQRGRVVIFDPAEGGMPPGAYRTATQSTEALLARGAPDLDDPAIFDAYFAQLFPILHLDAKGIQQLRSRLEYERVATEFRMIEDDTVSVIAPYRGLPPQPSTDADTEAGVDQQHQIDDLIAALRPDRRPADFSALRRLRMQVQPYLVSLWKRAFDDAVHQGLVTELSGGLWAWEGGYDDVRGLVPNRSPDEWVF